MLRNTAGQKITVFVLDATNNIPKTSDAGQLTLYVSIDDGTVTVLGDTSATELDATNAKGSYSFDLTQAETNGTKLHFTGKSSTSGVYVFPVTVYTVPSAFALVAGAAGGLFIAGTNAATTITTALTTTFTGNLTGSVNSVATGVTISGTLATLDALWVKVRKWLQLMTRKDAAIATDNATELGEINANMGTGAGSFDNTTDAEQGIADAPGVGGTTDWTTGERQQIRMALGVTGSTAATTGTGVTDLVKVKTDQMVFSTANQLDAKAIQVVDKTGYSLSVPADLTNDAAARASMEARILAIFNVLFNKATQDAAQRKVYNDANTLFLTMSVSNISGTQTKDKSA